MEGEQAFPFGGLLQRARVTARLTQEQLADRAGLSATAVAALESGTWRTPHVAIVQRLAQALDLPDQEREAFQAATGGGGGAREHGAIPRPLAEPPTTLLGRESELEAICRRLAVEGVRLLTLSGPAGVGKTRLALAAAVSPQLADRFRDGVVVIDLAPVREPQLVLSAIGHALSLADAGSHPLQERLREYLSSCELLLVLDNFEQVLPAAAALAGLLASCPGLAILVTSRVPLRLRWEQTLRVAPLPVPDLSGTLPPPAALLALPSVVLFVERARARQANFALTAERAPLVAQLVAQLDGLPLALELAAARIDVLSLTAIVRRLGDRLQLLRWEAPDLPKRQWSLEAAVGWSYELLDAGEQRLFRCLGVFVGRVALNAIETVAAFVAQVGASAGGGGAEVAGALPDEHQALDQLMSLAEQSLILPWRQGEEKGLEEGDDPEPAFGMLETVREYAWEQLAAAGELASARRAHAHYYLALAERADPLLRGRDQRIWFLRLEREHNNLRAALRWLLDQEEATEREAGLRLAAALGFFWWLRGYHSEGVRQLLEALTATREADLAVRTQALMAAGGLLVQRGEFARAQSMLEEALALAQQRQDAMNTARALTYLGARAINAGDPAEGIRVLREALAQWQTLDDPFRRGTTLTFLGQAAFMLGDTVAAASYEKAALECLEAIGDMRLASTAHVHLALISQKQDDRLSAVEHARTSLHLSVSLQDRWQLSVGVRAALAITDPRADPARRARLLGAADALSEATGAPLAIWERETAGQSVAGLRIEIERGEWDVEYHAGRALPFDAVVSLALTLLEDAVPSQAPAHTVHATVAETLPQTFAKNPLSERESAVLRLVAQGLSNKAIGRELFISANTVTYHLTSVFHKLGVDTRAQAVAVAAQRSLL